MLKKIINTSLLACTALLLSFYVRQGSFKGESLKKAHAWFEQSHTLPGISTANNGDYHIEPAGT